jgi:hypothetical protein
MTRQVKGTVFDDLGGGSRPVRSKIVGVELASTE